MTNSTFHAMKSYSTAVAATTTSSKGEMISILAAKLSLPCKDETQFLQALRTALTWHFDMDLNQISGDESPLMTAYLANPKLAFIWIRNEPKYDSKRDTASESLANIPKFTLSGPLSMRFEQLSRNSTSFLLEIKNLAKEKRKLKSSNDNDSMYIYDTIKDFLDGEVDKPYQDTKIFLSR